MYKELGDFFLHIAKERAMWKDGELWTAIIAGLGAFLVFLQWPHLMDGVSRELSNLLTLAGILLGFIVAAMSFYVSVVPLLRQEAPVQSSVDRIIDWHVWTALSLLGLIIVVLITAIAETYMNRFGALRAACLSAVVLIAIYAGGQVLNHILTIWWFFRRRSKFFADD